jgi:hypothetical protein
MPRFLVVNATWLEADSGAEANARVASALQPLKVAETNGYGVAAPEGDEWGEQVFATLRDHFDNTNESKKERV